MHAIGFSHEHQRPDRDKYISLNWNNIPLHQKSSFTKQRDGFYGGREITNDKYKSKWGYDYYSIMHYPWYYWINARLKYVYGCNKLTDVYDDLKNSVYDFFYTLDKTWGYREDPNSLAIYG
ncbi:hypothetical protein B4U80_01833 [Leptotrombidium deliense]|uniref:Peptidase M12A domain-containing protein n=1 Tax=Leptotrombidium deliense TaxID=299467 RepID=A0A443S0K8_9ACAR|nr:hypothetical protein B4U80_01833 [Leptotrombidium deliense]